MLHESKELSMWVLCTGVMASACCMKAKDVSILHADMLLSAGVMASNLTSWPLKQAKAAMKRLGPLQTCSGIASCMRSSSMSASS